MQSDDLNQRLANILGWIQIAKQNLPAINDGAVTADRLAAMSGFLDRMHRVADAIATQNRKPAELRRRAA